MFSIFDQSELDVTAGLRALMLHDAAEQILGLRMVGIAATTCMTLFRAAIPSSVTAEALPARGCLIGGTTEKRPAGDHRAL
ncbi:hypothetical protein [Rhodovibrio salinarum]|uniref:Uncharacterized protein n=1 Tax=Rhodovibrio salinarum TaxID=1087 RepID=A0A934V1E3_9PROT|nr:hypothetical protein [Rhodovibrio salinarum]MBK1698560.1 hypothetical protein [Rhodovibrio salinarum]